MHPQLQAIADEFTSASHRLHRLIDIVPAERWGARADPDRWSIAECIAHLNLTSQAFRPLVEQGLDAGRKRGGPAPERYRRNFTGWLLWKMAGPPVRFRVKTTAPFIPQGTLPQTELVERFDRLQEMQLAWVTAADGLRLHEIHITSPFNARIRYNLYACLTILPRHQHRHLWQAEATAHALHEQ